MRHHRESATARGTSSTCAIAIGAASAPALYLVAVASPAVSPAAANPISTLRALHGSVGRFVKRAQEQEQGERRQQGHERVGHREMRLPDVEGNDGEEERRDRRGHVVGDDAGQPEEHDDGQRSGDHHDGAGDDEVVAGGQRPARGDMIMNPRRCREGEGEEVERQRSPVEEVRVEIAADHPERAADGDFLVGTGAVERQAERDGHETQQRAEQDDQRQPALRRERGGTRPDATDRSVYFHPRVR